MTIKKTIIIAFASAVVCRTTSPTNNSNSMVTGTSESLLDIVSDVFFILSLYARVQLNALTAGTRPRDETAWTRREKKKRIRHSERGGWGKGDAHK